MITSKTNQKIRDLVQLRDKCRARKEQGVFLAEGPRMFMEAPEDWLRDIYVSESFEKEQKNRIGEKARDCRVTVLSDAVFSHVSDTKTPQGVLCVLNMPEYGDAFFPGEPGYAANRDKREGTGAAAPLLLMLEGIQDPGNLGTLFRSAEGAGASGILMDRACADIFQPKSVRATMGSIFRVPFWISGDLPADIERLKAAGVLVCAAHLAGSVCYDEPDYTGGCAFLIGNEGRGLREETAALADKRVRIPMAGKLESLNAAVSGSLLLYEADRQRRAAL